MTINLTDPQAPVTDEELDQMIWKLERDGGMTPKMLSLMRELREVRRNSPAAPDGWIPVSERMPEVGDIVLTAIDGCVNFGEVERSGVNYRYFTSVISGRELPATHWHPLPAAPKEVG